MAWALIRLAPRYTRAVEARRSITEHSTTATESQERRVTFFMIRHRSSNFCGGKAGTRYRKCFFILRRIMQAKGFVFAIHTCPFRVFCGLRHERPLRRQRRHVISLIIPMPHPNSCRCRPMGPVTLLSAYRCSLKFRRSRSSDGGVGLRPTSAFRGQRREALTQSLCNMQSVPCEDSRRVA